MDKFENSSRSQSLLDKSHSSPIMASLKGNDDVTVHATSLNDGNNEKSFDNVQRAPPPKDSASEEPHSAPSSPTAGTPQTVPTRRFVRKLFESDAVPGETTLSSVEVVLFGRDVATTPTEKVQSATFTPDSRGASMQSNIQPFDHGGAVLILPSSPSRPSPKD